jgi:hypothetical protein
VCFHSLLIKINDNDSSIVFDELKLRGFYVLLVKEVLKWYASFRDD